jgi:hypothetical protein
MYSTPNPHTQLICSLLFRLLELVLERKVSHYRKMNSRFGVFFAHIHRAPLGG